MISFSANIIGSGYIDSKKSARTWTETDEAIILNKNHCEFECLFQWETVTMYVVYEKESSDVLIN